MMTRSKNPAWERETEETCQHGLWGECDLGELECVFDFTLTHDGCTHASLRQARLGGLVMPRDMVAEAIGAANLVMCEEAKRRELSKRFFDGEWNE